MMIILIILLVTLSILTGVFYVTLTGAAFIFRKWINKTWSRKTRIFSSLLFACLTAGLFLFTSPAKNYNTAAIEPHQQHYKVTVRGKRVSMAHDPISALFRNTYEDSVSFIIPGNQGIIMDDEIKVSPDRFNPIGSIDIKEQEMTIELYYNEEKTEPNSWNGKYKLFSRE